MKKQSQSKKSSQGHAKPLVANHKLDRVNCASRTAGGTSSSSYKSQYTSDIKFYHSFEPYFDFTNFADYPIRLDGKLWPTTEHYFQAQKFVGTPYEEAIRRQPSARGAFDMSRNPSVSHWRRGDWNQVKTDIMLKCLRAKFTQYKRLRKLLLDTGDRKLVEHTSNDSYWGDGGDGSGQNKLGRLLMQVRKELQDTNPSTSIVPYHSSSVCDYCKYDYKGSTKKDKLNEGSPHRHRRRNSFSDDLNTDVCLLSPESKCDRKPIKHQRSHSYSNIAPTSIIYHHSRNPKPTEESCHTSLSNRNGILSSESKKTKLPSNRHLSRSHGDLSQYTGSPLYSLPITITNSFMKKSTVTGSSVPYDIITGRPKTVCA